MKIIGSIALVYMYYFTDINECAVNNGGCGQICNDTMPGYICSCYLGYQLLPDGMNCTSKYLSSYLYFTVVCLHQTHHTVLWESTLQLQLPSYCTAQCTYI